MRKGELAQAIQKRRGSARDEDGLANPFEVQAFLDGVDYPVRKRDLVCEAKRHRAPADVRATLEQIADRHYGSPTEVSEAIGELT